MEDAKAYMREFCGWKYFVQKSNGRAEIVFPNSGEDLETIMRYTSQVVIRELEPNINSVNVTTIYSDGEKFNEQTIISYRRNKEVKPISKQVPTEVVTSPTAKYREPLASKLATPYTGKRI